MPTFPFTLEQTRGAARAGRLQTAHGEVLTPIFMPVGTLATVKSLDTQDIEKTQAEIILANTYHLYLRPGMETLQELGGIHQFMGWQKPILTDSGGFQVFSLGKQLGEKAGVGSAKLKPARISDDGVEFTSHLDGSRHFFDPATSITIQRQIGADIIMAFDECTPDKSSTNYANEALARTHRWADQSVAEWEANNRQSVYGQYQLLFGIVQGALHKELRQASARFLAERPFDGLAVGGETIGYNMPGTVEVMSWIEPLLPATKPRYAMGLGRDPQDIIDAVLAGFDMFDCVGPTRLARNGALYSGQLVENAGSVSWESSWSKGRLNIGNAQFTRDNKVLEPTCDCATCVTGYSRAYLHHLYKTQELAYYRLASVHNVRTMVRLSQQLRQWLLR